MLDPRPEAGPVRRLGPLSVERSVSLSHAIKGPLRRVLTCRWQPTEARCQQGTRIDLRSRIRQILVPEPEHLWCIDDAGVFVLLVAASWVSIGWEQLWVACDRYIQYLAHHPGHILVSRFLCQYGGLFGRFDVARRTCRGGVPKLTMLPPALPPATMIRSGSMLRSVACDLHFPCQYHRVREVESSSYPQKHIEAVIYSVRISELWCHAVVNADNHRASFGSQESVLDLFHLVAAYHPA
jgi:hypothetical protein